MSRVTHSEPGLPMPVPVINVVTKIKIYQLLQSVKHLKKNYI